MVRRRSVNKCLGSAKKVVCKVDFWGNNLPSCILFCYFEAVLKKEVHTHSFRSLAERASLFLFI